MKKTEKLGNWRQFNNFEVQTWFISIFFVKRFNNITWANTFDQLIFCETAFKTVFNPVRTELFQF